MIIPHSAPKTNLDAILGGPYCDGAVQFRKLAPQDNLHNLIIKNHDMVFGLELTFLRVRSVNDHFNSKLNVYSEI